jgi:hypothetical protein
MDRREFLKATSAGIGALMLPWTAEICLDRIGRESLYLPGETDDP